MLQCAQKSRDKAWVIVGEQTASPARRLLAWWRRCTAHSAQQAACPLFCALPTPPTPLQTPSLLPLCHSAEVKSEFDALDSSIPRRSVYYWSMRLTDARSPSCPNCWLTEGVQPFSTRVYNI